jgi:hypothetical protein
MKAAIWIYILATAVAISPAFGQTITPDSPEARALAPLQHFSLPMRRAPARGLVANGTVETYNWGGYAVTGTGFTSAKGSWIVPTVTCSKSPNAWVSVWVGIDGFDSDTVEQTGTTAWCNKTTAEYFTWYELYPAGSVTITTVPSKPGNKISAEVSYNGSEFTVEITDETTGKSFSKTQAVSGAKRTSAEWIAESPYWVTSTDFDYGILNLADFTTASFGDDYTGITGTNSATDSTVSGPISDFGSAVNQITHEDYLGYTESKSSPLSKDGSSFTVTWVEYN